MYLRQEENLISFNSSDPQIRNFLDLSSTLSLQLVNDGQFSSDYSQQGTELNKDGKRIGIMAKLMYRWEHNFSATWLNYELGHEYCRFVTGHSDRLCIGTGTEF
jgi:hypothetical protein